MRIYVAALLLALPLTAVAAQHNPAENDWSRIQTLPAGKSVTLKANGHKTHCHFVSADADSITCASGEAKTPAVFPRSQVTLVQADHRTKSTLIGLGVGAAGGAIFGASVGKTGGLFGKGEFAAVFAIPGAVVGALIGGVGNFAHTTLYRAP